MYNSPRVYHKLRTNARLTSKEENKVRRARRQTFNKLKVIESETARLQDRLAILHQKKKETEDYIDVHQRLISPIRRLLPEILQEIFWRCLPTAHNSVLSFEEAPLLLGRVCSQWRQVACSTPKLWSSLHIIVVPFLSPRAEARFEAFNTWLARSGILPLYISMATILGEYIWMYEFQPYFDLIARHARRLKAIHLRVNLHDPLTIFMDIHASDLPLLETFHIEQNPLVTESTTARSLLEKDSVLFAPLLRVLSIREYSLRLLDFPVQWAQLTGLNFILRDLEVSDVFELLKRCSNLETCSMNFGVSVNWTIQENPQLFDNGPKVVLPNLRTLKIQYGKLNLNYMPLILLNSLSTPALRHFAYQHFVSPHPPWINIPFAEVSSSLEVFRSFFQRLNEPLEELDFATDHLEARYLMEFLSLFPELKRLSLGFAFFATKSAINDRLLLGFIPYEYKRHCQSCSIGDEQVEELDSNIPSFSCLCPKLEVLDIDDALFSEHVLLECLQSRLVDYDRYNLVRLRRFTISFDFVWGNYDRDMTGEIERLAEESGIVDMRLIRRSYNGFIGAGEEPDFD